MSYHRQSLNIAIRTLKLVGSIVICFALVDYTMLLFPTDWSNRTWQLNIVTQLVNKGLIPLLGISLLFTGFALDSTYEGTRENRPMFLDLRFLALCLASLLGLTFFLMFPLHIYNVRVERDTAIVKIGQEFTQKTRQVEAQINSDKFKNEIKDQQNKIREEINAVLANPAQLQAVLNSDQVPEKMKNLIKEAQKDRQALEKTLIQEANMLPGQLLSQVRNDKDKAESKVKSEAFRATLQTGISSLLLAIGYLAIGLTGFRSLGLFRLKRKSL